MVEIDKVYNSIWYPYDIKLIENKFELTLIQVLLKAGMSLVKYSYLKRHQVTAFLVTRIIFTENDLRFICKLLHNMIQYVNFFQARRNESIKFPLEDLNTKGIQHKLISLLITLIHQIYS